MRIFSIRDLKSGHFNQPAFDKDSFTALRSFETLINESDSLIKRYPNDFALYELAEFNALTGEITSHNPPRELATAISLVRPERPQSGKQLSFVNQETEHAQ